MDRLDPRGHGLEVGEAGKEDKRRDGDGKGRRLVPGECLLNTLSIPSIQIKSKMVRGNIELWKERAFIGKFVGVWPKERDLFDGSMLY